MEEEEEDREKEEDGEESACSSVLTTHCQICRTQPPAQACPARGCVKGNQAASPHSHAQGVGGAQKALAGIGSVKTPSPLL